MNCWRLEREWINEISPCRHCKRKGNVSRSYFWQVTVNVRRHTLSVKPYMNKVYVRLSYIISRFLMLCYAIFLCYDTRFLRMCYIDIWYCVVLRMFIFVLRPNMSCKVTSNFGNSCKVISCCTMLCHAMSCHVMLCYAMSCQVMLCHDTLRRVFSVAGSVRGRPLHGTRGRQVCD